jgi:hypothetical protein
VPRLRVQRVRVIYDRAALRVSVFTATGDYVRSFRMETDDGPPHLIGRFGDGTFLVRTSHSFSPQQAETQGLRREPYRLLRYSAAGEPLHALGDFPGAQVFVTETSGRFSVRVLPFGRNTFFAVDTGTFYAADNDRSEIRVFSRSGDLRRLLRIGESADRLNDRDVREEQERWAPVSAGEEVRRRMERVFAETSLPETLPAFRTLQLDRLGYLWVADWRRPTVRRFVVADLRPGGPTRGEGGDGERIQPTRHRHRIHPWNMARRIRRRAHPQVPALPRTLASHQLQNPTDMNPPLARPTRRLLPADLS